MSFIKHLRTATFGLLFFSSYAYCQNVDYYLIASVETQARDSCQKKLDDDTIEFKKCIQKKAADSSKEKDPKTTKLAIYYYGWLASVVAAKNGIPTSEETARYLLPKFRVIQKELKISDLDLCQTIPGDCVSRNARMIQMENYIKSVQSHKPL